MLANMQSLRLPSCTGPNGTFPDKKPFGCTLNCLRFLPLSGSHNIVKMPFHQADPHIFM